MGGIVGILGKNFSGKSSIIDSFLYTVYNSTSKNNRKNLNLINQNEDWCRGYVEIDVGAKTYKIERTSKKYKKKLKGKQTLEAKTDVEFVVHDSLTGQEQSLNGVTRIETDNNIRKIFGTIDDFLLTSMGSQLDSLSYLNEGSTKRKEILAKFLDLQFFEKKFKMCNEENVDLKGAIKRLSNNDYDALIDEARIDLARAQAELSISERKSTALEQEQGEISAKLENINNEIYAVPKEITNYKNFVEEVGKCGADIKYFEEDSRDKESLLQKKTALLTKIENFLSGFDIDVFNKKKDFINEKQHELERFEMEIKSFEEKKKINYKKIESLKKAPCNMRLKEKCHFVKDAAHALSDTQRVTISLNQLKLSRSTISEKIKELNPDKVTKYIKKYYMVLEKKSSLKEDVTNIELEIEKNKVKLLQLKNSLNKLQENQTLFNENKKSIETLKVLTEKQQILESEKTGVEKNLHASRKQVLDFYKNVGSLEQRHEQLLTQQQSFLDLQDEYTTSDLFMRCMHPNGISYDIIKRRLPVINDEI